jgi:hypothetical protein
MVYVSLALGMVYGVLDNMTLAETAMTYIILILCIASQLPLLSRKQ